MELLSEGGKATLQMANGPYGLKTALMSKCGGYRYSLLRAWGSMDLPLIWVMLNPSTADAVSDDPTIRRVRHFTRAHGFNAFLVLNLFNLRTSSPSALIAYTGDRLGERSNMLFEHNRGKMWVAAWGAHAEFPLVKRRANEVIDIMGSKHSCLGVTRGNHPRHPLYVQGLRQFERWAGYRTENQAQAE